MGFSIMIHEIKFLLQSVNFDVLAITETHLLKNITDEQISIEGYKTTSNDRKSINNNWGGCLIYSKEGLKGFEREDLNADPQSWKNISGLSVIEFDTRYRTPPPINVVLS